MDELEPYEPSERDRAMELVREWRANADVLESHWRLIRYASDWERFEHELNKVEETLDGIDAGELDEEIDEDLRWLTGARTTSSRPAAARRP